MNRTRIAAPRGVAVALLAPASANAAVRTATINDGLDMQDTAPGFHARARGPGPRARLRQL